MQVREHRVVLWEKLGAGPHPCHWCDLPLDWSHGTARGVLQVDHLDDRRGNNDPGNLVASCHACNKLRSRVHGSTIMVGEPFVTKSDGRRVRAVERTCQTCGNVFLVAVAATRDPKAGRYCSMACVYRRHQRT